MGCCPRKPHSLAAAWASHVLGVLTHSDVPPRPVGPAFPVAVLYTKSGQLAAASRNRPVPG
jgi:hypothetical protein